MSDTQNEPASPASELTDQPLSSQPAPGAWPPLPHGTDANQPAATAGAGFVPLARLARWSVSLLLLFSISYAANQIIKGATPDQDLPIGLTALVALVAVLPSTVVFLVWVYRIYANLRPLGARQLKVTPGWAVGYFFIPIINLFKPYQIMDEAWKASEPGAVARGWPSPEYKGRSLPVLGWWWFSWLAWNLAWRVETTVSRNPSPDNSAGGAHIVFGALCLLAGVLAARVVVCFTHRQEDTARQIAENAAPI